MNWFVSLPKGSKYLDCCEHVTAGEPVAAVTREDDGFGPGDTYAECRACLSKREDAEGQELKTCHDCKRGVPARDGFEWTWYDFYAPQGDEPLFICDECWGAPPHKTRMKRDAEAAQEEDESYAAVERPNG